MLYNCLTVLYLKELFRRAEDNGNIVYSFSEILKFCVKNSTHHLAKPQLKMFLLYKLLWSFVNGSKLRSFRERIFIEISNLKVKEFVRFFVGDRAVNGLPQRIESEVDFFGLITALYLIISEPKYNSEATGAHQHNEPSQAPTSQIKYKFGVYAMINLTDIYLSLKNYSEEIQTVYMPALYIEAASRYSHYPLQSLFERFCDFTSRNTFKCLLSLIYLCSNKYDLAKMVLSDLLNATKSEPKNLFDL
jgi:hypothetical protein